MRQSSSFLNSLQVTLWFNLIINPAQVIGCLAPAVLLSQKLPAEGVMRLVVFLPAAIPQSVATVIWDIILRPDSSLANSFLQLVGIAPHPFLTSQDGRSGFECQ